MDRPLYQVVIDTIIERIASGALQPGAMLPSEIQLGQDLGVSQGTARKALIELEQRGLVQRAQGRGTFVTVQTPESALFNFFRFRQEDGSRDAPNLLHQEVSTRAPSAAEIDMLFGSPDRVYEVARLRGLSDGDRVYETSVVPTALFPGLAERAPLPNTLYVFYQQAYSCIIVKADEDLSVEAAPRDIALKLDVPKGTPLLRIERRAIDALDRCVECRLSYATTRSHSYSVSLK